MRNGTATIKALMVQVSQGQPRLTVTPVWAGRSTLRHLVRLPMNFSNGISQG